LRQRVRQKRLGSGEEVDDPRVGSSRLSCSRWSEWLDPAGLLVCATGEVENESDDQLEGRGNVAADRNRRGFRMTVATKRVVVTVEGPGADWHVEEIDELPITEIDVGEAEIFANGWRNIQSGVLVSVRSGAFIAEYILPMVRLKRAHVFPLRITDLLAMPNLYPTAFANRLSIPDKSIVEPRNDLRSFRLGMMIIDVIVRKGDVEGILSRSKANRHKIDPIYRVWTIWAAVT
jgi:hypothetical protein